MNSVTKYFRPIFVIAVMAMSTIWIGALRGVAFATDFYELQMYTADTVPEGHLMLELHTNDLVAAQGEARQALPIYQYHNTFEFTYGLLPWLEVGQYICTGELGAGQYEYAGGRSKVHFGIPQTEAWPIQFGANIEFQYMRRAAVSDPLNIEFMPIVQGYLGHFFLVANPAVEKQFAGPGTHAGISFGPSAAVSYRLFGKWDWLEPALEYYGDTGAVTNTEEYNQQQQFIVPGFNLYLDPRFEFNFGVGFGVPGTLSGQFVKATIGWQL
ncbi:MAG: hypothetical protein ACYDC3_06640 [Candidatus Binataceae bacterium]